MPNLPLARTDLRYSSSIRRLIIGQIFQATYLENLSLFWKSRNYQTLEKHA
ncbi:unnamed protein product [Callosobruchus maculatus]|uniref:Uncharacterized protein n=1 Tax=Callosobruchus maculatus TaxID=64391 RepID=A0A653DR82_CALMS|nr:unnamed protein product [Callosobruchus maculatus]